MYDADNVFALWCIVTICSIHFLSSFRNPVLTGEIADKTKELNTIMNTIVSQMVLLDHLENRDAYREARKIASNISRETHPVLVVSDIVEEDAQQLVQLLTKDATEEQRKYRN